MPNLALTLSVGLHAQGHFLGGYAKKTLIETVKNWVARGTAIIPTPHPSWRSTRWLIRNPWFGQDLLLVLRQRAWEFV